VPIQAGAGLVSDHQGERPASSMGLSTPGNYPDLADHKRHQLHRWGRWVVWEPVGSSFYYLGGVLYGILGHPGISEYLLVPYYPDGVAWATLSFVITGCLGDICGTTRLPAWC